MSSPGVILKEGELLKSKDQKRKTWNQKWVILTQGAIYYYRKKTNYEPAGVIELKEFELEDNPQVRTEKKNVIVLRSKADKTKRVLFSSGNEQDREEWHQYIKQQLEQEPSAPPENAHAKAKGKGTKYAIQANVASSIVGRKIIKEVVDADSWKALDSILSFLKKAKGEEVAAKFKKDLVRIGTKLAIFYNNKLINDADIDKMQHAMRILAQTVVDYYQMPSIFDAATLVNCLNNLRKTTEPHLEGKIKPNTLQKYKDLFELASNEELLTSLFEKGKWPELEELSTIIRKHITAR